MDKETYNEKAERIAEEESVKAQASDDKREAKKEAKKLKEQSDFDQAYADRVMND